MQIDVLPSWQDILSPEIEKAYFKNLMITVDDEYHNHTCYPPKNLIFNAFNHCDFDNLKVVILGQDPYHGFGQANGLSFSVNDDARVPPSLLNIFKEINPKYSKSQNLDRWAKQGVLLLNTSLTVQKDKPNSHEHLPWKTFTNAVINIISDKKNDLVFMLWGKFAQNAMNNINGDKHFILQAGHPSFASIHKKWFGNNHFNIANDYLKSNGKIEIDW